jgi:glycine hydroxymethyltransferase
VSSKPSPSAQLATSIDPELKLALDGERRREEEFIELIASENYVSPAVLQALASPMINKYACGVPGRRQYSGCEYVDQAERLAIDRACRLFGSRYANVQPYSGSQANQAGYQALLNPGDTILGLAAGQGGHITHGASESFSGRDYRILSYGVNPESGLVDFERLAALAARQPPKLLIAGFSAHSRIMDWQPYREIANSVGAYLMVDMAHVAGLVAAGLHPNPVPVADVVTTTTHKSLRGPRGGMLLAGDAERFGERLDAAVYPGIQGGPLMNIVAAKAVAFAEALTPAFRIYQQRVIANARCLAAVLAERGFRIFSGVTENHMLLVELGTEIGVARQAQQRLEAAKIAVSSLRLPNGAGGLRLGTAAVTTRGLMEPQIRLVGGVIADILERPDSAAAHANAIRQVAVLAESFPVYTHAG